MVADILTWLAFLKFAIAGTPTDRAALHDATARRSTELTMKLPDMVDALIYDMKLNLKEFEKHSESKGKGFADLPVLRSSTPHPHSSFSLFHALNAKRRMVGISAFLVLFIRTCT